MNPLQMTSIQNARVIRTVNKDENALTFLVVAVRYNAIPKRMAALTKSWTNQFNGSSRRTIKRHYNTK